MKPDEARQILSSYIRGNAEGPGDTDPAMTDVEVATERLLNDDRYNFLGTLVSDIGGNTPTPDQMGALYHISGTDEVGKLAYIVLLDTAVTKMDLPESVRQQIIGKAVNVGYQEKDRDILFAAFQVLNKKGLLEADRYNRVRSMINRGLGYESGEGRLEQEVRKRGRRVHRDLTWPPESSGETVLEFPAKEE